MRSKGESFTRKVTVGKWHSWGLTWLCRPPECVLHTPHLVRGDWEGGPMGGWRPRAGRLVAGTVEVSLPSLCVTSARC